MKPFLSSDADWYLLGIIALLAVIPAVAMLSLIAYPSPSSPADAEAVERIQIRRQINLIKQAILETKSSDAPGGASEAP